MALTERNYFRISLISGRYGYLGSMVWVYMGRRDSKGPVNEHTHSVSLLRHARYLNKKEDFLKLRRSRVGGTSGSYVAV